MLFRIVIFALNKVCLRRLSILNILSTMTNNGQQDPSMARVLAWVEKNKMPMAELGRKMGFDPATARQAVFQFLKGKDPRISTLRRFAAAAGVDLAELVAPATITKRTKK
jgi:hypothetical protein